MTSSKHQLCSYSRAEILGERVQGLHVCISPQKAEQLRTQLQLAENARDGAHKDLIELHRRLQDGEEAQELQCKERLETRRALGDETREKEIMQKSNTELRAAIKKTESERIR